MPLPFFLNQTSVINPCLNLHLATGRTFVTNTSAEKYAEDSTRTGATKFELQPIKA